MTAYPVCYLGFRATVNRPSSPFCCCFCSDCSHKCNMLLKLFIIICNFLLILCEFYNHAPKSQPSPIPLISAPCPFNLSQKSYTNERTTTTNTTRHRKHLTVEVVVCLNVSHSISFCPHIFTCKCLLQLSHWSGSRSLSSVTPSTLDPHQDTSQSSHCYPLSWRTCNTGKQDWIFQCPNELGCVNSEVWICTWVVAELVSPLALPYPHHQGELSSTALARPPSATISRRQG